MKILVACEESQVVCKAFRERGHEAYSCDIQRCSGGRPEWHIVGDVLPLLNGNTQFITQDGVTHYIVGNWDMLIAHPPCTYLSKVSAPILFDKEGNINLARYYRGLEAKFFFMTLYNCSIPKICIENPTPLSLFGLPYHSQVIQPYWFGHPYSKRTLLWLKGLPPLFATLIEPEYESWCKINRDSKIRSKTFPGIAMAMAEQWG